jgi:hypothetical protein
MKTAAIRAARGVFMRGRLPDRMPFSNGCLICEAPLVD